MSHPRLKLPEAGPSTDLRVFLFRTRERERLRHADVDLGVGGGRWEPETGRTGGVVEAMACRQ